MSWLSLNICKHSMSHPNKYRYKYTSMQLFICVFTRVCVDRKKRSFVYISLSNQSDSKLDILIPITNNECVWTLILNFAILYEPKRIIVLTIHVISQLKVVFLEKINFNSNSMNHFFQTLVILKVQTKYFIYL